MREKLFITVALAALLLTACGNEKTAMPEALDSVPAEFSGKANPFGPDAAVEGAGVYKVYCASCHGETGLGDGAAGMSLVPAPKNLAELGGLVSDDYLFWRIYTGKSGTAMVAWKGILSDEQIWQVVALIRTLE